MLPRKLCRPCCAMVTKQWTFLDVRLLLDMVMSGTVSTMLARRWECSLLVNVGNETLKALLNNPKAIEALKKAKKEVSDSMSKTEKKELTQEEKEIRFKRNELGNLSVQTIQRNVPDLYGTEQTRKRTSWAVGYQNHGRRNAAGEKHLLYGKSYPFLLSVHKRIKSGNYRGDSIFQIFFKCGKIVLIPKDNVPISQVETNIFPFSRSVFFF